MTSTKTTEGEPAVRRWAKELKHCAIHAPVNGWNGLLIGQPGDPDRPANVGAQFHGNAFHSAGPYPRSFRAQIKMLFPKKSMG